MIDLQKLKDESQNLKRNGLGGRTSDEILSIMQIKLLEGISEKLDKIIEIFDKKEEVEDKRTTKPTTVKK